MKRFEYVSMSPGSLKLSVYLLFGCTLLWLFGAGCAPLLRLSGDRLSVKSLELDEESAQLLESYLQQQRATADSSGRIDPHIAVLPLHDQSGFRRDVWNLGPEMARLISEEMALFPEWQVVPFEVVEALIGGTGGRLKAEDAVELGRLTRADLVLLGTIDDYNMGRFSVGDPLLAGYKSYTGTAHLLLRVIRVEDGSEMASLEAERDLTERDLGLDLLGKPREQDLQFTGLRNIAFGSPAFRETVLGEATLQTVDELLHKLAGLVRPRTLPLGDRIAQILSIDGGEVYVNVGSENGLRAGYRFRVLPGAERVREEQLDPRQSVGAVEVMQVIGARLSSVRILTGHESVRAGDRLELVE